MLINFYIKKDCYQYLSFQENQEVRHRKESQDKSLLTSRMRYTRHIKRKEKEKMKIFAVLRFIPEH